MGDETSTYQCFRIRKSERLHRKIYPGGALRKCTYGEVSPIFLGLNISKSNIFGSKITESHGHDIFWA